MVSNSTFTRPVRPPRNSVLGAARPQRKVPDWYTQRLQVTLVWVVLVFLRRIPAAWGRCIAKAIGRLACRAMKSYRQRILKHMDLAFGETYTIEQKKAFVRRNFEHIALSLVETARMMFLTPENVHNFFDLTELEALNRIIERFKPRGTLLVPGHHGNWELAGYVFCLCGYAMKSVARPLDNPGLNALLFELRTRSGNEILDKWNVLWKLKKLLDRGELISISIDQNGGVAGVFVPLFGVPASTVATPAELQLATEAPIVVLSVNRQPDEVRHKLHLWATIEPQRTDDHEADRLRILTQINQAYEKMIGAYPEQWLWVHKRWKTRPKDEPKGSYKKYGI